MEEQKNNELFIVKPNLKQYYGRTITKEMEFDEWTDNKEVHQTLKDLVLTTIVKKESEVKPIKDVYNSFENKILTVCGRIFFVDSRETRSGDKTIATVQITDESSSVSIKFVSA